MIVPGSLPLGFLSRGAVAQSAVEDSSSRLFPSVIVPGVLRAIVVAGLLPGVGVTPQPPVVRAGVAGSAVVVSALAASVVTPQPPSISVAAPGIAAGQSAIRPAQIAQAISPSVLPGVLSAQNPTVAVSAFIAPFPPEPSIISGVLGAQTPIVTGSAFIAPFPPEPSIISGVLRAPIPTVAVSAFIAPFPPEPSIISGVLGAQTPIVTGSAFIAPFPPAPSIIPGVLRAQVSTASVSAFIAPFPPEPSIISGVLNAQIPAVAVSPFAPPFLPQPSLVQGVFVAPYPPGSVQASRIEAPPQPSIVPGVPSAFILQGFAPPPLALPRFVQIQPGAEPLEGESLDIVVSVLPPRVVLPPDAWIDVGVSPARIAFGAIEFTIKLPPEPELFPGVVPIEGDAGNLARPELPPAPPFLPVPWISKGVPNEFPPGYNQNTSSGDWRSPGYVPESMRGIYPDYFFPRNTDPLYEEVEEDPVARILRRHDERIALRERGKSDALAQDSKNPQRGRMVAREIREIVYEFDGKPHFASMKQVKALEHIREIELEYNGKKYKISQSDSDASMLALASLLSAEPHADTKTSSNTEQTQKTRRFAFSKLTLALVVGASLLVGVGIGKNWKSWTKKRPLRRKK